MIGSSGSGGMQRRVTVINLRQPDQPVPLVDGIGGIAEAVIWPGMGARHRSLNFVHLDAGGRTRALVHPSECVYYVMAGSGSVDAHGAGERKLCAGEFLLIQPRVEYRVAAGLESMRLFGGPCPPDPLLYTGFSDGMVRTASDGHPTAGEPRTTAGALTSDVAKDLSDVRVFSRDEPMLLLPMISEDARMIVWPGVGAWNATMNYVRMRPGEENRCHAHADCEDTIVILEGRGSVDDLTNRVTLEFQAGDVVHVPPGVVHAVKANRGSPIVSAGGPCPADIPFLRAAGAEFPDLA